MSLHVPIIHIGLIERAPRGRTATEDGYGHIGAGRPSSEQQKLIQQLHRDTEFCTVCSDIQEKTMPDVSQETMLAAAAFEEQYWLLQNRTFGEERCLGQSRYAKLALHLCKAYAVHRRVYKMQACRLIPAEDKNTASKYLAEAHDREWIAFASDVNDRRKIEVLPTEKLIGLVDTYVREFESMLLAFGK